MRLLQRHSLFGFPDRRIPDFLPLALRGAWGWNASIAGAVEAGCPWEMTAGMAVEPGWSRESRPGVESSGTLSPIRQRT
jgi:hypothetical protein